MKYLVRAALVIGAAAALGLGCSKKNKLEKAQAFPDSLVGSEVIALVNGDTILGSDLRVLAYLSMTSPDSLHSRSFNNMLLDQLIDRAVFVQEAKAAGVWTPDSTVDWSDARASASASWKRPCALSTSLSVASEEETRGWLRPDHSRELRSTSRA